MGEWIEEWINAWIDGHRLMDGRMGGWMNEWMHACKKIMDSCHVHINGWKMKRWMNGFMKEWDKWINGWKHMNGWMHEQMFYRMCCSMKIWHTNT